MATATSLSSVERLVIAAKQAGVPRDSLERFLSAGYVPQPKQLEFHAAFRSCDLPDGPTQVGIGGARGGAKSHSALAQVGIDDCQRIDGLKWLFLRKVGKAARESFEDLRRKVLMGVPHDYKRQEGMVVFPNDSRILLGHFKDEKDIDSYLGIEYDGVCIEESNQLSQKKHEQISTCVRTSKANWRPRIYHTTNPGGIGHAYFKKTFIEPWRRGVETDTRFVFATFRDNRALNADYVKTLDKLTGWLRAAWRDGDWDIAAGQFFTTWRHDIHVKNFAEIGAHPLPAHWTVWASMDYGFTHPTVVYLFAKFDGRIYIVDEYYEARKLPKQNAEGIKAMLARHNVPLYRLSAFVAGTDVFSQTGDEEGKTLADQYEGHGITLEPAVTDRISRAAALLELLGDVANDIEPGIVISDRCVKLIECMPNLQHDPNQPEKVLKVDVDEDGNGGDDPYDSGTYGIMADPLAPQLVIAGGHREQLSSYRHR
jgi:phage terminase large subunit